MGHPRQRLGSPASVCRSPVPSLARDALPRIREPPVSRMIEAVSLRLREFVALCRMAREARREGVRGFTARLRDFGGPININQHNSPMLSTQTQSRIDFEGIPLPAIVSRSKLRRHFVFNTGLFGSLLSRQVVCSNLGAVATATIMRRPATGQVATVLDFGGRKGESGKWWCRLKL